MLIYPILKEISDPNLFVENSYQDHEPFQAFVHWNTKIGSLSLKEPIRALKC